ncbi:hypothetical protein HAX54_017991, partial [Datura stramonium]|nr:hypothetical protein [Datura stramonium]
MTTKAQELMKRIPLKCGDLILGGEKGGKIIGARSRTGGLEISQQGSVMGVALNHVGVTSSSSRIQATG